MTDGELLLAARRFFVVAAFRPALRRFRVVAAFFAAAAIGNSFVTRPTPATQVVLSRHDNRCRPPPLAVAA
jgi:hypothetical protein